MNHTKHSAPKLLLLALATLCFTGCSIVPEPKADPTRYFVLSATAPLPGATAAAPGKTAPKPVIGLSPVETAGYLGGKKSMVTRAGHTEVVYHDYFRWAEAPEAGIVRIVSERLLATGRIAAINPLPSQTPRTWDLSLRILECEGAMPGGKETAVARFVAEYEFTRPNGASLAPARHFAPEPAKWDGKDFAALAALLGNAAAALADDIARNLPAE